ncbi:hypothetical protein RHOSPDRAFT_17113 [Rhodotorula sp. JG-1b]|nr:hypothetical protein RHOSPDRAFT_17113 [Rhodotorula sp. JG-1b]
MAGPAPLPRPASIVRAVHSGLHASAHSAGQTCSPSPAKEAPSSRPSRTKTARKRVASAQPPKPKSSQIRNTLVDYLATGRNADAIAFYVELLQQNRGEWTAETAEGFAWLFVQYRQADLARHAAAAIHDQGFAISTAFASKILRMYKDELVYEPEALAQVLEWLSEGFGREKREGVSVDEGTLETVLEVLKRMGRSDWLEQVFRAYRDTLNEGEIGSARAWSYLIGAKILDGNIRTAEKHFNTWRTGYRASHMASTSREVPPPSSPYLVLLAHYASRTHSGPFSRDPAYRFIALCRTDGIEISTDYVDLLLRTELRRKQHSSFWGLWKAFDDPTLDLVRSGTTWLLAIRAKMRADTANRAIPSLAHSPLRRLLSFHLQPAHAPSSRRLLKDLLRQRLAQTGHRPARRHPRSDPFVSADVLNLFLEHFVAVRDWRAATVVLETFRVHRVEPTFKTHGNVVLGVVKQWRRGKLQGRLDDLAQSAHDGAVDAFDDPQVRAAKEKGFSSIRSQQQGLELIRTILEERKMRARLWSREADEVEVSACDARGSPAQEEGDELDHPSPVTPRWMVQRERRDLGYLVSLLRRCEGVDEEEWKGLMAEARKVILPRRQQPVAKGSRRATRKREQESKDRDKMRAARLQRRARRKVQRCTQ